MIRSQDNITINGVKNLHSLVVFLLLQEMILSTVQDLKIF